jgi:hypothetical protein
MADIFLEIVDFKKDLGIASPTIKIMSLSKVRKLWKNEQFDGSHRSIDSDFGTDRVLILAATHIALTIEELLSKFNPSTKVAPKSSPGMLHIALN